VRRFETSFADYRARPALSQAGRPMWEGVAVRAEESALLELVEGGVVHESLVQEPKAA
jgi:hypothetical protein